MRWRLLILLCLLLAAPSARADNPYGLALWPAPGQDLGLTAARAAALGIAWFRPPTLYVDRWRPDASCGACRALQHSDLQLAITVRNNGHDRPSTPPTDLAAYQQTIGAILDQWRPALISIEDEENRSARFSDGHSPNGWENGADLPAAYRQELIAACSAAHARQIACSNGGLSFSAVAGLTWLTLLREGKTDLACLYARRTLPEGETLCAFHHAEDVPQDQRESLLQNAERLLPIYRSSPIDAVNIHWYGADANALAQTIDVIARLTGKKVMSNEIGQLRAHADPIQIRPLLRAAMAAHLSPAIWYSIDSRDSVSLFDPDGRLRPAGAEFAHQMSGQK
jgi:hypothetical protein